MALPCLQPNDFVLLRPEPLTPEGFALFGTVIAAPLAPTLVQYPTAIPISEHPKHQPAPVNANQQTALKTSPISPLTNDYPSSRPGKGLMSIFSSFSRKNTYMIPDISTLQAALRLKLGILERHPFTTQTFCPFNYSEPSTDAIKHSDDKTYMLVIVAPTTSSPSANPPNPPDLASIRAFFTPLNSASTPNMAVTYAPGTWHAPMIVLGSQRVDFLVTQFANGVANDDCQEVLIGSGPDESTLSQDELRFRWHEGGINNGVKEVEVDISFLQRDRGDGSEQKGAEVAAVKEKAKL